VSQTGEAIIKDMNERLAGIGLSVEIDKLILVDRDSNVDGRENAVVDRKEVGREGDLIGLPPELP